MKGVLVANKSPFPEAVDQLLGLVPKSEWNCYAISTDITISVDVSELTVNDVYRNVRIEIPPSDNCKSLSIPYSIHSIPFSPFLFIDIPCD